MDNLPRCQGAQLALPPPPSGAKPPLPPASALGLGATSDPSALTWHGKQQVQRAQQQTQQVQAVTLSPASVQLRQEHQGQPGQPEPPTALLPATEQQQQGVAAKQPPASQAADPAPTADRPAKRRGRSRGADGEEVGSAAGRTPKRLRQAHVPLDDDIR